MEIKDIEGWAKLVVDSEIDSEMYSRLIEKYQKNASFEAIANELSDTYYFVDSVYVESLLAAAYFFWRHEYHAHSIFFNCKRMIDSGIPIVALKELTEDKTYLKGYAINIRLFYDKVLSSGYGPFNENSAFCVIEKAFCE